MSKHLSLIATIVPLVIVFIGLIGWVMTLRNDVTSTHKEIESLNQEISSIYERFDKEFEVIHQRLDEELNMLHQEVDVIKDIQSLQENEMRTIMADHSGFADVLDELGKSGVLPSGERRIYGDYGK
jgi:predicted PurR-regulated permease PerM